MVERRPIAGHPRARRADPRRARSSPSRSTSPSSPRRRPRRRSCSAPMSLLPGSAPGRELHRRAAAAPATGAASNAPVGRMMLVSLVTRAGDRDRQDRDLAAVGLRDRLLPLPAAAALCFWVIFVTLMLPVEVRIGPTYKVVSDLGMLNTYAGLTVPLIASATATFLFRQFFLTVPDELVEAARIDGAGPMRFFKDVLLPLSTTIDRGAVRDPVHLRLEPVPVAAAGDHRREHVPGGDRHQAHDRRRRRGQPTGTSSWPPRSWRCSRRRWSCC